MTSIGDCRLDLIAGGICDAFVIGGGLNDVGGIGDALDIIESSFGIAGDVPVVAFDAGGDNTGDIGRAFESGGDALDSGDTSAGDVF